MTGIERIGTAAAPTPAGHYSQGTAWRDLIFISGQLPKGPDGAPRSNASFEDQARLALANLLAIASAGGGSADTVLRVTAYIVGIENWSAFNRIFAELFGDARPARAVVPVPELHHGYLVEVDGIAVRANRV